MGAALTNYYDLEPETLHLWHVDVGTDLDSRYFNLLSEDEKIRAGKYRFTQDQHMFIKARAVLRILSGHYLQKDPIHIRFKYGAYGRPYFQDENSLLFNVSHSEGKAIIGFGKFTEMGTDIEKIKSDFNVLDIAGKFFSQSEIKSLTEIPKEEQNRAFFRCWTRKESFIKAKGDGLSLPLDSFSVTLDDDIKARLIETKWNPCEKENWKIFSYVQNDNYIVAVSVQGNVQKIKYRNWDEVYKRYNL
ncbi:4'-phosphopantetheinyl transferase superfamily protein [Arenibacter sp. BSSL-BM3]|uniref:4'-phosphopantetheinyl transferase superfamily protein n=1 Tax=Arenibacter arenosicollis TaxID=2762274 RepID=A0ABR7QRX2_9FLAO|nr:4'-phosphopantetheinyl transferase superfamily protein [Arenibacter arenosicollis]MBC8769913.1 4'-phosphopantetheinyl transferase superfamily protein [Arenibacter arenosicollis]